MNTKLMLLGFILAAAALPIAARAQTSQPVLLASPQQNMIGDVAVAVAANTSTLIWTFNTNARVLRIIPNVATCFMQTDGNPATASSTPIPGGYVFNLTEPPPRNSIYAYCTSAGSVIVAQGN